jgi:deazaflavin-dependent oxidoreductase (nitroreductase family)
MTVAANEAPTASSAATPRSPRLLTLAFKVANALHCAVYRASRGRVGGRAKGVPVLLLTTTGRRTGRSHTVPVGYVDNADQLLLVGSCGGMPWHPQWYFNARANPRVLVQIAGERQTMLAEAPEGEERLALWKRVVAAYPVFEAYQRKVSRQIGVVRLWPVPAASSDHSANSPA